MRKDKKESIKAKAKSIVEVVKDKRESKAKAIIDGVKDKKGVVKSDDILFREELLSQVTEMKCILQYTLTELLKQSQEIKLVADEVKVSVKALKERFV